MSLQLTMPHWLMMLPWLTMPHRLTTPPWLLTMPPWLITPPRLTSPWLMPPWLILLCMGLLLMCCMPYKDRRQPEKWVQFQPSKWYISIDAATAACVVLYEKQTKKCMHGTMTAHIEKPNLSMYV